jgi:hypothetical protein
LLQALRVTAALVILLLVDLAAVIVLTAAYMRRRRCVTGRRGAFKGKLRVVEGEVPGLSSSWNTGYGHWVRDVLVWDMAPFLWRTKVIPVDGTDVSGIHGANGSVSRLGRHPIVTPLLSDHRSRLELATSQEDRDLVLGPFAGASAIGALVRARSDVNDPDELYPDDN